MLGRKKNQLKFTAREGSGRPSPSRTFQKGTVPPASPPCHGDGDFGRYKGTIPKGLPYQTLIRLWC